MQYFDTIKFVEGEINTMDDLFEFIITLDKWIALHGMEKPRHLSQDRGDSTIVRNVNAYFFDEATRLYDGEIDPRIVRKLDKVIGDYLPHVVGADLLYAENFRGIMTKDGMYVVDVEEPSEPKLLGVLYNRKGLGFYAVIQEQDNYGDGLRIVDMLFNGKSNTSKATTFDNGMRKSKGMA